MAEQYYKEQDKIRHLELQAKLGELPSFCATFFMGIEMRTATSTRLNYASDLQIFFNFLVEQVVGLVGKQPHELTLADLSTLRAEDLERFLSYLTYYEYRGAVYQNGARAKARKLSAVRSLFKYLYNKDLLPENVSAKVALPKRHDKPIVRLDGDEVVELLDNAEDKREFQNSRQDAYNLHTKERDVAILTLLLGTGIRVSELVGLDVLDFNMDKLSFLVTRKGGNRTVLYFNEETRDALLAYLAVRNARLEDKKIEAEPALFLSLQNKRISVRAVENLVKKHAATVSRQKISPHKLRSTFGTALYRSTQDIYVVAEVLGHKDVNTTKKHYAALSEDIKRKASEQVVLRDGAKNDEDETGNPK